MEETGFKAYWMYVAVKNIYFRPGSRYDIMSHRLPRKEQFLKSWNTKRSKTDGHLFYKIMNRMTKAKAGKEDYIRLFGIYCIKNPQFHVSDIFYDGYRTYKDNEYYLKDILQTVKSDYLTAMLEVHERDISPKKMFYGKMPHIFKLYDQGKININSLIAFHEIFGIGNITSGKDLNIVDQQKAIHYRLIFDKYRPLVYNFFKEIEWKKEIQEYHYHIMKYGR